MNNNFCLLPRAFATAPIFAACAQKSPRTVTDGTTGNVWCIGTAGGRYHQGLDIRHFLLLGVVLDKFRIPPVFDDKSLNGNYLDVSLVQLTKTMCNGLVNGVNVAWVTELLRQLAYTEITITNKISQKRTEFTILTNLALTHEPAKKRKKYCNIKNDETALKHLSVSSEFVDLMRGENSKITIDWQSMRKMTSQLSMAIYAYVPSRALHHDKKSPWTISLTKLLKDLGRSCPSTRSVRKQRFEQARAGCKSVIEQLDNSKVAGGIMRCGIGSTVDQTDYKLMFWVETSEPKWFGRERGSSIYCAWMSAGNKESAYFKRLSNRGESLENYQLQYMKAGKIVYKGNESYFTKVQALLGNDVFNQILADCKNNQARHPNAMLHNQFIKSFGEV